MNSSSIIKQSMASFFKDLLSKDNLRVELSHTSDKLSTRFSKITVPAIMMGLALGLSPDAQAEDLAERLPQLHAFVNSIPEPDFNPLNILAKNQEEAAVKYGKMHYMGETDRLMACETILGDTYNETARESMNTMSWLLKYSTPEKQEESLYLISLQCKHGDAIYRDAVDMYGADIKQRAMDRKQAAAESKGEVSVDAEEVTPVSLSISNESVAMLASDVLRIGYQNQILEKNIDAFNQTVMSDSGDVIKEGAQTPAQAFSQQVSSKRSAAGWASAAFSIAEGLARMSGNKELADQARSGATFSGKADRYYDRGKRAVGQDNTMRGAQGIGNIIRDMGHEIDRSRRYSM